MEIAVDLIVIPRSCSSFRVSVRRDSPARPPAMIPALARRESVRLDFPWSTVNRCQKSSCNLISEGKITKAYCGRSRTLVGQSSQPLIARQGWISDETHYYECWKATAKVSVHLAEPMISTIALSVYVLCRFIHQLSDFF